MFVSTIISIFVACYCFQNISSISIIPERTIVTYVNQKYMTKNATINVRRSSKRGEFVFNIIATTLVPFGNNVTFNLLVYEHSTKYNQYVRSFIEFHLKICDMIHKDQIFGAVLRKINVTQCPIFPGPIDWRNITLTADFDFPIPFVKGKAEMNLKSETANEVMGSADIFFLLKEKKNKG